MAEYESLSAEQSQDFFRVSHAYEATFTYHHGLVQIRFVTLALYLGAAAFIGNLVFASHPLPSGNTRFCLLLVGAALAFGCLLLDLRTCALLRQLVARGADQEAAMNVPKRLRFFPIMNGELAHQGLLGKSAWLVSHSRVFDLIYVGTWILWVVLAFYRQ